MQESQVPTSQGNRNGPSLRIITAFQETDLALRDAVYREYLAYPSPDEEINVSVGDIDQTNSNADDLGTGTRVR